MCMTLSRLGKLYGVDYDHPSVGGDGIGPTYENWDKDSVTSCFCDPGFSGPDCSRSAFQRLIVPRNAPHLPFSLAVTCVNLCHA